MRARRMPTFKSLKRLKKSVKKVCAITVVAYLMLLWTLWVVTSPWRFLVPPGPGFVPIQIRGRFGTSPVYYVRPWLQELFNVLLGTAIMILIAGICIALYAWAIEKIKRHYKV